MRFLIDVDGVLGDAVNHILMPLNEKFGTNITEENITDFLFMDPEKGILTPSQAKCTANMFSRPGFTYTMPTYKGAREAVKKIKDHGHEVVFVTAPWGESENWCYDRTLWLEELFDADPKKIIFTHSKHMVKGDILIDDRIEHCLQYAEENPSSVVLLYSRPWNINLMPPEYHWPANIFRFDWNSDLLNDLLNKPITKGRLDEYSNRYRP